MKDIKTSGETPFQKEVVESYILMEETLTEMFKDVQNGNLIPYKSGAVISDCLTFVATLAKFSSALATRQLLMSKGESPDGQLSQSSEKQSETSYDEDFSDILNDKELLHHLATGDFDAIEKFDSVELLSKLWKFFRFAMLKGIVDKNELLQMNKHLSDFSVALLKGKETDT